MATKDDLCVACGEPVQPGQRWILVKNNVLLTTWREIFREKLNELNLEVNECSLLNLHTGCQTTKGFICRKCKRGLENYNSAKKKLLDNAGEALKNMNTTSRRKRQRQDEDENPTLPLAKRAFRPSTGLPGHSPDVQVTHFNYIMLIIINNGANTYTDPNRIFPRLLSPNLQPHTIQKKDWESCCTRK